MYFVYKHICPNGKVYIGMTGKDPEERWRNGFGYESNKRFFKAIVKYGWDNIKHEILSRHETKQEALREEAMQIVKHNSDTLYLGYNCLPQFSAQLSAQSPAQNAAQCPAQSYVVNHAQCTPVAQYTKDGQHIATYKSLKDAGIATGISTATICLVCKQVPMRKTAGGYIWRYVVPENNLHLDSESI